MPPFLQFLIRRFLAVPISLVIITLVLYGGVMLTPPEARATLYYPPNMNANLSEERMRNFQETIIKRQHLRDPFLVQYGYWVASSGYPLSEVGSFRTAPLPEDPLEPPLVSISSFVPMRPGAQPFCLLPHDIYI